MIWKDPEKVLAFSKSSPLVEASRQFHSACTAQQYRPSPENEARQEAAQAALLAMSDSTDALLSAFGLKLSAFDPDVVLFIPGLEYKLEEDSPWLCDYDRSSLRLNGKAWFVIEPLLRELLELRAAAQHTKEKQ